MKRFTKGAFTHPSPTNTSTRSVARSCITTLFAWLMVSLLLPPVQAHAGPLSQYIDAKAEVGDPSGDGCPTPSQSAGNPLHVALGNKFEHVPIYTGTGSNPIRYDLYYNSNPAASAFWLDNYQSRVALIDAGTNQYDDRVYYLPADGGELNTTINVENGLYRDRGNPYSSTGTPSTSTTVGWGGGFEFDCNNQPRLSVIEFLGGGYDPTRRHHIRTRYETFTRCSKKYQVTTQIDYLRWDGAIERYSPFSAQAYDGWRLTQVIFPNGENHTLNFDVATQTLTVTHSNGQSLTVQYEVVYQDYDRTTHKAILPALLPKKVTAGTLVWDFTIKKRTYSNAYRHPDLGGQTAYIESIQGPHRSNGTRNKITFAYATTMPGNPASSSLPRANLTDTSINGQHYAGWLYNANGDAYASYHGPTPTSGYAFQTSTTPTLAMLKANADVLFADPNNTGVTYVDLSPHDDRFVYNDVGHVTTFDYTMVDGAYNPATGANDRRSPQLTAIKGNASTNCVESNVSFVYDSYARVAESISELGTKTKYTYSDVGRGRPTKIARAYDQWRHHTAINITWADQDANQIDTVTYQGFVDNAWVYNRRYALDYDYQADGRLQRVALKDLIRQLTTVPGYTVSADRVWSYGYQDYSTGDVQQITVDGPRTDVTDQTVYRFDTLGRLVSVTNALNQVTEYKHYHDGWQVPQEIVDANGNRLTIQYTAAMNAPLVEKITDADGNETSLTYNAFDLLETITYPSGLKLTYRYKTGDAESLYEVEANNGDTLSLQRTPNRTQQIADFTVKATANLAANPSYQRNYKLDGLGRLYKAFGVTTQTEYNYSKAGQLSDIKEIGLDANGQTKILRTQFGYDILNRLAVVAPPAPEAATMTAEHGGRDPFGNLLYTTERTTPYTGTVGGVVGTNNQYQTAYLRTSWGEIVESEDAQGAGKITYTYDIAGNLKTRTDARNITIEYSYDALGRLTNIHYPTHGDVVLEYDQHDTEMDVYGNTIYRNGKGRLTTLTDATGKTEYYYTKAGYVRKVVRTQQGKTFTTRYEYTKGLLTKLIYPSHRAVIYEYDAYGRLAGVSIQDNTGTRTVANNMAYKPFGPLSTLTYGNNLTLQRQYNADYDVDTLETSGVYAYRYQYDTFGDLDAVTHTQSGATLQDYRYDRVHRLLEAALGDGTYGYVYDKYGNRTSDSLNSVGNSYNYLASARLNSITGRTNISYAYDASRNIIQRGTQTFTYNEDNQLASAYSNGQQTTYGYDAQGRRTFKNSGSEKVGYLYGLNDELLAEFDLTTGSIQREYLYRGATPIALVDTRTFKWVPIFMDDLFFLVKVPLATPKYTLQFIHTNHLGTPEAVTDASGHVVWRGNHTPFGEARPSGSLTFNLRFPGQYFDRETGLHYNHFRYYDPHTGRYTQPDPIGLAGGDINLFAYVGGNPVMYYDFYGLAIGDYLPPLPQEVVDFSAGAGDAILMGYGGDLRNAMGIDGGVNPCSGAYGYGTATGVGVVTATGAAGAVRGLAWRAAARQGIREIAEKGTSPDEVFSSKAPKQTTPGTKTLEGQHINDKGRVEPWKAHYDEYGRQIGRTDYNAGNKTQGIPSTHHHTKEYNSQFPAGRSTGDHIPGEYNP
jgi:RHS repeat-associated protein